MSTPLATTIRATFDTNKNAQAQLGPAPPFHRWNITRMVTSAGLSTDKITLIVYRNIVSPGTILDSTYQGIQATSETDITLYENECLIAAWSGGTPNTEALLNFYGDDQY